MSRRRVYHRDTSSERAAYPFVRPAVMESCQIFTGIIEMGALQVVAGRDARLGRRRKRTDRRDDSRSRKLSGRGGRIANIASLPSFQGGIRIPSYTALKSRLARLIMTLFYEWSHSGTSINAVASGYGVSNTSTLCESTRPQSWHTRRYPHCQMVRHRGPRAALRTSCPSHVAFAQHTSPWTSVRAFPHRRVMACVHP